MERFLHPHPELVRKLLHVSLGLVVLTFPWVFAKPWPVVLLAAISTGTMTVMKLAPRLRDGVGTVLTGVGRASVGEICFPIAVGALALLSRGNALFFVVPMLILTLADAVAALVGVTYGKVHYGTTDGWKSAEGSIAFFSVAFLSVHLPLLLFTNVGRPETVLIAIIIGLLSTLIEAVSARGLDNLLIPLGAFGFLRLYLDATPRALLLRLAATAVLTVFALSWRRRTTLDDSALMACALFGYGAAMLGGWLWLIGPAIVFLVMMLAWPRTGQRRKHSVAAVASVTLAGLVWLALQDAFGGHERFFVPYAIGFGAHLAIIGVSRIAGEPSRFSTPTRVILSILAGWTVAAAQIVPLLIAHAAHATMLLAGALGCVALSAIVFYVALPFLYGPKGSPTAVHVVSFAAALLGSVTACVLVSERFAVG